MVCCDWLSWAIVVLFFYFVVRKIISVLRIDRCSDVYVLITGCDSGFGHEAARRFDRLGCHVFAGCLTDDGKESLKAECSDRLHAISLDVTKQESIREAYDYVKTNIPKGRGLWGVINNAGISGKFGHLEWLSLDDYRDVFQVNLYGLINVTMTFLPLVKKARGRIVNTSSIAGRYSAVGTTHYCMSKFGVEAFTDGLRRSLRPFGVKAILVEPGCYKTQLIAANRVEALVNAAWNGASEDVKKEFGEHMPREMTDGFLETIERFGSEKVTDVVDAYEMGLLGRYPRARYAVGRGTRILILLLALPDWLGDWILQRLQKVNPKPACLR